MKETIIIPREMKNIAKISLIILFVIGTTLSCTKNFEEMNTSPNSPTDVPAINIFTNVCVSSPSNWLGGWIQHTYLGCWCQQWTKIQYIDEDKYQLRASQMDDFFGSHYTTCLKNLEIVLSKTKDYASTASDFTDDGLYAASLILKAWNFAQLTDVFGDVPYFNALQGFQADGDLTPAYDPQEQIYKSIIDTVLVKANDILGASTGNFGAGDVIYDGDILKWRKLINSFRIRLLMSLSAKEGNTVLDPAGKFREIIENPDNNPVFTGPDDQGQLSFYDRDGNRYPLFNDRSIMTANYMEKTFVNILKQRKDPRLFRFASPEKRAVEIAQPGYQTSLSSFGGLDGGAYVNDNVQTLTEKGEGSPLNARYYSDPVNEPAVAVGYPELEFNIAEAALRGWITEDAASHYEKGITASMSFFGITPAKITSYLNGSLVKFDPAKAMEQINTQKYIAYFLNSGWEAFYNQRRTGIPGFSVGPATQNGGQVPKRWMYPQSELDYNYENVSAAINRQYEGNDNVNGVMWLLKPEL